jgi:hypothetical protein
VEESKDSKFRFAENSIGLLRSVLGERFVEIDNNINVEYCRFRLGRVGSSILSRDSQRDNKRDDTILLI